MEGNSGNNSHVRALDFELVSQKAKTHAFKYIERLNLWGLNLGDVSILKDLPNLKIISLTSNYVETLEAFASCPKLEEIYLRKNQIRNLSDLQYLKNLPNLKVLWLSENPCSIWNQYRDYVIQELPQLEKLDDLPINSRPEFHIRLPGHQEST